jgi:hypothetical protein
MVASAETEMHEQLLVSLIPAAVFIYFSPI